MLLAASRAGYATLNELLTHAHASQTPVVTWSVQLAHTHDLACLTGARDGLPARFLAVRQVTRLDCRVRELKGTFPERLYVQLFHTRLPWDGRRARVLRRLAQHDGLPVVAAPEVRHAQASDHRLLDAPTCARLGITVDEPHPQRPQNEAGALPSPEEGQRRLPFTEAHLNADRVAERDAFDLLHERLVPPRARVLTGLSPAEHLERRCYEALLQRQPGRPTHPGAPQDRGRVRSHPRPRHDRLPPGGRRGQRTLPASRHARCWPWLRRRLPLAIQDLGRALGIPPPRHARHLAPHNGGVVFARDPLTHGSPLQRSSGGITLLHLDKDGAEALGLITLELLGLRMLTALERAREEALRTQGEWIDLDQLADDPRVWDAIAAGTTMGLLQIESSSQVNTARVMRSRTRKNLAHQIALIRRTSCASPCTSPA